MAVDGAESELVVSGPWLSSISEDCSSEVLSDAVEPAVESW